MQLLYPTTIDDMVAVFLKAEIRSERFEEQIVAQLSFDCEARSVVETPAIRNVEVIAGFAPECAKV